MGIIKLITFVGLFFLFACTHQMNVSSNYVASNPDQFKSSKLKERRVALLIGHGLQNYVLVKKVSSKAGGYIIKDKFNFFLGNAVAAEIENMARVIFDEVQLASSFNEAIDSGIVSIVPEIVGSSLDLPVKRGGDTTAWITVEYHFYGADGVLITEKTVTGKWSKSLLLTKENYNMAFQRAIIDLTIKSKRIIENAL